METFPESKLNAIRDYLKIEFSGSDLADRYDFERLAQTFRLHGGEKFFLLTIAREFIDDHIEDEISRILKSLQLKNYFNRVEVSRVIVKNSSVETE